jgi:hypothetical protein
MDTCPFGSRFVCENEECAAAKSLAEIDADLGLAAQIRASGSKTELVRHLNASLVHLLPLAGVLGDLSGSEPVGARGAKPTRPRYATRNTQKPLYFVRISASQGTVSAVWDLQSDRVIDVLCMVLLEMLQHQVGEVARAWPLLCSVLDSGADGLPVWRTELTSLETAAVQNLVALKATADLAAEIQQHTSWKGAGDKERDVATFGEVYAAYIEWALALSESCNIVVRTRAESTVSFVEIAPSPSEDDAGDTELRIRSRNENTFRMLCNTCVRLREIHRHFSDAKVHGCLGSDATAWCTGLGTLIAKLEFVLFAAMIRPREMRSALRRFRDRVFADPDESARTLARAFERVGPFVPRDDDGDDDEAGTRRGTFDLEDDEGNVRRRSEGRASPHSAVGPYADVDPDSDIPTEFVPWKDNLDFQRILSGVAGIKLPVRVPAEGRLVDHSVRKDLFHGLC